MNGAIMPEALPIVSCIPVAVVLLPYRGELFGSYREKRKEKKKSQNVRLKKQRKVIMKLTQANGRPTTTYRPAATRKHLHARKWLAQAKKERKKKKKTPKETPRYAPEVVNA
jgi:hypothetical protein